MPSPLRQKRVADRLLQVISQLLQSELSDPRLALVTVTRVNIDRELEYANVFVSTVGDETRRKEVLAALERARGLIRREVARRVQLRRAPEIIFHWDPAPEKAEHVAQLLDQIKDEQPGAPPSPADDDSADTEGADRDDAR